METNKTLIIELLHDSLSRIQMWNETSNPCMFTTCYHSRLFSIERKIAIGMPFQFSFCEWNEDGDIIQEISVSDNREFEQLLSDLFDAVVASNDNFKRAVMNEDKLIEKSYEKDPTTIDLDEIIKVLAVTKQDEQFRYNIMENDSFYYAKEFASNYVAPPLIQLMTYEGYTKPEDARVIFVSAPGATGKSALSAYLSFKLGIPIFDLGIHKAVGAHSLVGLLVDNLSTEEYVQFKNGLENNHQSMIIDGLDEGEIKVNKAAFESFLDDIVKIASVAEGVPFIMLGRSQTVENSIYYLESHGIPVSCIQIEPFTMDRAIDFIDMAMASQDATRRYQIPYKEVQEYIIDSIHGFFEDDGALECNAYDRFIGYAPVLMAIISLLIERQDYNKLLNEFLEEKRSNIDLVLSIIEKVLYREQEKIRNSLLPDLLIGYDKGFASEVIAKAASIEEQCGRLLCFLLHRKYTVQLTDNQAFNIKYQEKMNGWMPNHPFLDVNLGTFRNIVFESYVVARLSSKEEFVSPVVSYLSSCNSNSYLLFDFYDKLVGESRSVDYLLLPFLFDSFRALDHMVGKSAMEMISSTEGDFIYSRCDLSFYRDGDEQEVEFVSEIPYDATIELPSSLSGITIDIPLKVRCSTPSLLLQPPVYINCKEFEIKSRDIVVSRQTFAQGEVVIECDSFKAFTPDGTMPCLVDRTGKSCLKVGTNDSVYYPFNDYQVPRYVPNEEDENGLLIEKYNKLRRAIILFRSNGKENLARIQDKIHSRICNTNVGKAVVEKLIEKRILVPKGYLFFLDTGELDKQLGLSFNSIHYGVINDKTRKFLLEISC